MKTIKLTLKEITELQPSAVAEARQHRTIVGGLQFRGELDMGAVRGLVTKHFGSDCIAWKDYELEEGDGCFYAIICAKL